MTPLLADLSMSDAPVLGGAVLVIVFLSSWLFNYRRDQREASGQFEPRATPALHHQFVTRAEFEKHTEDISKRLDKIEEAGEQRVIRIYDKLDKQTERIIEIVRAESSR
ncbi:MAG TPA: hypothetical protein VL357_03075 [Rariglobus sp.]|jgi:hypothetical protein|nr:hypothetical protein [Rariglobus sp.]